MTVKVTLRQKAITKNRQSLYLDFYPAIKDSHSGVLTRREFLGMYIYNKANTPILKEHNRETLQLAQQIRQKRENEINKPEIYTEYEKEQLKIKELGEQSFIQYFEHLANKRKTSNHNNWISAHNYLNTYTNGSLTFANLDLKFCNNFKDYLLTTPSNKSNKTTLAQNSALSYFNKFKAALKQAYKDGYIQTDLNARVQPIKPLETHRQFLTLEELNTLVKTECSNPTLKTAALFSALTGLRFSDINNLLWGNIQYNQLNGYYIQFTQQKTKGAETLPISLQAYQLLGTPAQPTQKVFTNLRYSAYLNKQLQQWVILAGITKKITFHSFRHTFATLQLSLGTEIYTVSKMLGHQNLKTTQIYAKVIDQTKQEAANKIKLNM